MTIEQKIQEDQYDFPYHYLPQRGDNFEITYYWSFGLKYISAFDLLLKKMAKTNFDSVIDIGTGDGRLPRELTRTFPGKRIVGVDYSKKAIRLAEMLNPTIQYMSSDITKDDLGEKFDCATMVEVFEHIPIDLCRDFAHASSRLLNPGGHLFITVPHINMRLHPKHFQHFSAESLYSYYEEWFELEEVKFLHPPNFTSRVINRLMFNRHFALRNQSLLNKLYDIYCRKCLVAESESEGQRLFMILKKK
jgi:SAM-dependent methyltransferase